MLFPLCTTLLCQEVIASNSVRSKPTVTPVGGAVSHATPRARRVTALDQQTVTFV